ncbi:hypothetical protein [Nostoc sp. 106C]|uniref:hypothetical protein n=1 Tax=Nostoc sp. 106C TaxID=1932667 RepID=UPI000A3A6AEE|nr:hypothetical protein [Nostoc sp. 106C]OUL28226.1 hypothetical protein BV375_18640 [Nostoc sp. 106C]
MAANQYSPLFRLASQLLKYFFWLLFGMAIAFILAWGLRVFYIIPILMYLLKQFFMPMGFILLCLITIAIILESWR